MSAARWPGYTAEAQAHETRTRPHGYTVYEGPSLLDGAPIVVVALTGGSTNRKTGSMVQTYILRADVDPINAVRQGADASICGDCKHRGDGTGKGRTCYVTLAHGPRAVYAAWKRGAYPPAPDVAALGDGRAVRLGTYGDPAAVPVGILRALVSRARLHTGYTHQWRTRADLADLVMASADNVAEFDAARALGFRAFIVRTAAAPVPRGAVTCPASEEAGKRTQCERCGLCDGARPGDTRKSITIIAHGTARRAFTGA
jgi:hypothetical protein